MPPGPCVCHTTVPEAAGRKRGAPWAGTRWDGAMDARHRLVDDPFGWQRTASGQVWVTRGGRLVAVIAGAAARRLDRVLDGDDEDAVQHALARATGNYRRGNER